MPHVEFLEGSPDLLSGPQAIAPLMEIICPEI